MAVLGLERNLKWQRLSRMLPAERRSHLRGYLELLWDYTYQRKDAILGDASEVELIADWPGAPGGLVSALLGAGGESRAGFIEPAPGHPGVFQIHDLYDNAPDYVRKAIRRRNGNQTDDEMSGQCPPPTAELRHNAPSKAGQGKAGQGNSRQQQAGAAAAAEVSKSATEPRKPLPPSPDADPSMPPAVVVKSARADAVPETARAAVEQAARAALTAVGIRREKADELLLSVPGLTADVVNELDLRSRKSARRNPTGLLLTMLVEDGPAMLTAARNRPASPTPDVGPNVAPAAATAAFRGVSARRAAEKAAQAAGGANP